MPLSLLSRARFGSWDLFFPCPFFSTITTITTITGQQKDTRRRPRRRKCFVRERQLVPCDTKEFVFHGPWGMKMKMDMRGVQHKIDAWW